MTKKTETKLAWHWLAVGSSGKPVLRDGTLLRKRVWLRYKWEPKICERGLHGSYTALDALKYAPGCYVTRVKVAAIHAEQDDKFVCKERMPLWGYDATAVILKWSKRVALDVVSLWDCPAVVLEFLNGDDTKAAAAAGASAEKTSLYNTWLEEMLEENRAGNDRD